MLDGTKRIVINGTKGKLVVEGEDLEISPIRDCFGYWKNLMVAVRKTKKELNETVGELLTIEW